MYIMSIGMIMYYLASCSQAVKAAFVDRKERSIFR